MGLNQSRCSRTIRGPTKCAHCRKITDHTIREKQCKAIIPSDQTVCQHNIHDYFVGVCGSCASATIRPGKKNAYTYPVCTRKRVGPLRCSVCGILLSSVVKETVCGVQIAQSGRYYIDDHTTAYSEKDDNFFFLLFFWVFFFETGIAE